jgi:hypothetical protein
MQENRIQTQACNYDVRMNAYIREHENAYIHTYVYIHAYIHTYMHAYKYTYPFIAELGEAHKIQMQRVSDASQR